MCHQVTRTLCKGCLVQMGPETVTPLTPCRPDPCFRAAWGSPLAGAGLVTAHRVKRRRRTIGTCERCALAAAEDAITKAEQAVDEAAEAGGEREMVVVAEGMLARARDAVEGAVRAVNTYRP